MPENKPSIKITIDCVHGTRMLKKDEPVSDMPLDEMKTLIARGNAQWLNPPAPAAAAAPAAVSAAPGK